MTDAELSLAVAMIMWSEYVCVSKGGYVSIQYHDGTEYTIFYHTTDDALGKMAVWLAKKCGDEKYTSVIAAKTDWAVLTYLLQSENPHRELAEAIVEVGGSK